MTRRVIQRMRGQRGFTLIELLFVMLVIGILAAIALPSFIGQSEKGKDADAKSNARNLVSQIESCYSTQEDFRKCSTEAELGGNLGMPYGNGPGEVEIVSTTSNSYVITATSRSNVGGAYHTFTIDRDVGGQVNHSCTGTGGGCDSGDW